MKRTLLYCVALMALLPVSVQAANNYGIPENIQDGNILHCFDWPIKTVTENLPNIAEAGYGAVQLSPLQRKNVTSNTGWSELYRPYDYAFQATSGMGNADDLRTLCAEARKYGIKVIVDVVANHVDKSSGYHDSWWDSNSDYVRSKGGNANINYNSRYSITHDRLGDYYELNTENPEVVARAKAYIQDLHDMGVRGIRWDAAKHIELPSEGSTFWTEVTSVPDMFHYGEILSSPGPGNGVIEEYASLLSVTDSDYSDRSAKSNGGVPTSAQGNWASNSKVGASKVIYWGESHDTYSNTADYGGWSTGISQSVIDRAYAAVACRKGSAALYFARPTTAGFSNIKIGKGTDAYRGKAIREVNKFRNKMGNKSDAFSLNSNRDACSVTRENGGAVIVMKTSGAVSVPNGNSYLAPGVYTDRVSGTNTFTVTSSTIEGEAGPTGIVVLYEDADEPIVPDDTVYPEYITIFYDNSATKYNPVYCYYWGGSESNGWPGTQMKVASGDIYYLAIPENSNVVFNNNNGTQTADCNAVEDGHVYKGQNSTNKTPVDDLGLYTGEIEPDTYTIYYDDSITKWGAVNCYYWKGGDNNGWPGSPMTKLENEEYIYKIEVSPGYSVIFCNSGGTKQTADLTSMAHKHLYQGKAANKSAVKDLGIYEEKSGVSSIIADSDYSIRRNGRNILLEGLEGERVLIVGVDGKVFYNSPDCHDLNISLPSGMYIIRIGQHSTKIFIP
ncbi:MAG: starch-binding protein [Muribaculaceae bacterium]|nr:starch-binding protein [Muribaculaceae bacterium]